nr:MAG TPA: hypothetical protein [Caudoviricetes sp.]
MFKCINKSPFSRFFYMFLYVFGFVKILCNGGFTRNQIYIYSIVKYVVYFFKLCLTPF